MFFRVRATFAKKLLWQVMVYFADGGVRIVLPISQQATATLHHQAALWGVSVYNPVKTGREMLWLYFLDMAHEVVSVHIYLFVCLFITLEIRLFWGSWCLKFDAAYWLVIKEQRFTFCP